MTVSWNFTLHEVSLGPGFAPIYGQALGRRQHYGRTRGRLGDVTSRGRVYLETARTRDAVVVTLDADFHQMLAASRASSPSVVRIRIERLKGDQVAAILLQIISAARTELEAGAVVSVTPGRIRVRALPIGR